MKLWTGSIPASSIKNGLVAQLAEQDALNIEVQGSTPCGTIKYRIKPGGCDGEHSGPTNRWKEFESLTRHEGLCFIYLRTNMKVVELIIGLLFAGITAYVVGYAGKNKVK